MDEWVELTEIPSADEIYMIAGWHQWADAGAISSGLPQYLIELGDARKIGEIRSDDFYLFQIPGTHHFLRPEIKLEEGHRKALSVPENEFYYAGDDEKGLVIFIGEEPHLRANRYATAFFDAVEQLGVRRVAAVGGVYGEIPYEMDRDISCVYSLREMKEELEDYAVRFSNYEGGTTIGTYLIDQAEKKGVELLAFYAFVPAYDFSEASVGQVQGLRVENDYKAWYDVMSRLTHMFGLDLDLTELERYSEELLRTLNAKIDELERELPQLRIRDYIEELTSDFTERPFSPLSDVWAQALGDLFEDSEE